MSVFTQEIKVEVGDRVQIRRLAGYSESGVYEVMGQGSGILILQSLFDNSLVYTLNCGVDTLWHGDTSSTILEISFITEDDTFPPVFWENSRFVHKQVTSY